MAFFRFNRDKRGYEHFYLVEPVTNRRGKTRPRVLYWYRTPPNVRVGRVPFDEDVQRLLEAQNPSVTFDWRKIIDAPIPSAEAEKWRERRRVEKAEKAARRQPAARGVEERAPENAEAATPADDAPLRERTGLGTAAQPYHVSGDQIRKRRRRRRGHGPRADASAPLAPGAPDDVVASSAASETSPSEPSQASEPSQPSEPSTSSAPIDAAPTDTPGD